ncbi:hypothetical protein Cs7R123_32610 [Catellatospora sp. TT07R-123]|uniref:conjugal transfer protein TrbL family protein n=1 Tax=Catellatospora sp. TT07R-123 TaxID=2733863 RepID=UPI001AFEBB27|nr:conjugal transfer protein TrbL family protein [Catellatospora sp. TT07R-123]GHJ45919.1 hypothetical protein Cs7R123_32610 [Catellatospora sp. TT07R-123]
MRTECDLINNPTGCPGDIIDDVIGGAALNAWESVCKSFADAAVSLMKGFAGAFAAFPKIDLMALEGPYGIAKWVGIALIALLLLVQVVRTAVTHDGSALATGVVGVGKAALAFAFTLWIAQAGLEAADEITEGIISRSFGDSDGLKERLTLLFQWGGPNPNQTLVVSGSLMLILSLVGIVLTLALWFEMLLRQGAILVLLATAPIAAAGLVSESTRSWWSKMCAATIQLIVLKPVIALVFAIGFGVLSPPAGTGPSEPVKVQDLTTLLAGMLILLMAVVAWPVIARFFTFTTVHVGSGGMAGLLGFAAGRANSGGGPVGVNPAQFAQVSEARTMASAGAQGGLAVGGPAGAGAGAGTGAAGVLGAAVWPVAVAAAGIDMAQRAVNSLSGRMEQMAGHAGIQGAQPHGRPAGHPQFAGEWSSPVPSPSAQQPERAAPAPVPAPAEAGPAGLMPETRFIEPAPAYEPGAHVSPIEEVQR